MSKRMISLNGGMVSMPAHQPSPVRASEAEVPPTSAAEPKELVNFRVTREFRRKLRHMAADANLNLSELLVEMAVAYEEKLGRPKGAT